MKNSPVSQNLIIYQGQSGKIEFKGDLEKQTVWANLNQISELYGRDKSVVSRHINNIFKERELTKSSTVAKFATVQIEGSRSISREIEFYNLDMIISVGGFIAEIDVEGL
ncbi:virulence RhuM family protein [candidate division WWE3 bacterium]|uniref:Virulence RhuM family protein n=1 Tax=candidate division WWE3 bacterium TaxID=2053526 RepID=A0A955LJU4_UNCKA|nr:virulence RhuM family protein [candidate division WWE3 bacterium]